MKACPKNIIESATATDSQSEFPASYMLTPYTDQRWKGVNSTETVTCPMTELFDTVVVLGIDGVTDIDVEITADDNGEVLFSDSFDLTGIFNLADFMLGKGFPVKQIWIDTGFISRESTLAITFHTFATGFPACGLIWGGISYRVSNFSNGFSEGRKYPNIRKNITTGSPWVRWLKRVNRTFVGTCTDQRQEIRRLMMEIDATSGANPFPWLIADDLKSEFTVYALFDSQMPKQTHNAMDWSNLTLNLLEVT